MLTLHSIAKFLHVAADIGLFFGNGLQVLALILLRKAQTVDQVRAINHTVERTQGFTIASVLLTLATGVYMTMSVWSFTLGWIQVALAAIFLVIMPLILLVVEPRTKNIKAQLDENENGRLSQEIVDLIYDPFLTISTSVIMATLIGIVFLMTIKPTLLPSVTAVTVFIALGILTGLLAPRRHRSQDPDQGNG